MDTWDTPSFIITSHTDMNIAVRIFWCTCSLVSVGTHLAVQLLNHRVYV